MESTLWTSVLDKNAYVSCVALGPVPGARNSGALKTPDLPSYLGIRGQTDEHAGSSAEQPARRHTVHTPEPLGSS
jgi:hypothetical protein